MNITRPSGSKPATIKIKAPWSPAWVRGNPSPQKGIRNPRHWHVKIKGK